MENIAGKTMGKTPNIHEVQDIMREDQLQFERTIVRVKNSKSLSPLDTFKLGEFSPEVSDEQVLQGLPMRKTALDDT